MKRSTQVSLVLMTVAGIGAYALAQNRDCQSSHGSGSHGVQAFGSGGSGAPSATDTTSRGGFGGTGCTRSGGG
jgi:hypothetical protein